MQRVNLYHCNECGEKSQESTGLPLYECGECGTKFNRSNGVGRNGTMCPECQNKFGSRITDDSCAECEAGEVEVLAGLLCDFCDEAIPEDDAAEHLAEEHAKELAEEYLNEHPVSGK